MRIIKFDTVVREASVELDFSTTFNDGDILKILTSDMYYDYTAAKSGIDSCSGCSIDPNKVRGSFLSSICDYCRKSDKIYFRLIGKGRRSYASQNSIPLLKFKSVYCNQDTCPYHSKSCLDDFMDNDISICLLKKLIVK